MATLHQCKQFKTEATGYVIMYTPEELEKYGEGAEQKNCNYSNRSEQKVKDQ